MPRLPPSRAEMAVLGAVLIDPESIDAVARLIRPDDFEHRSLRTVYETALALVARGVRPDYVALCDELERTGRMATVGGDWVLTRLINECPSSLYAEQYARQVAEASARRRPPTPFAVAKGGLVL